jgi:hypothetical protein
MAEISPGGSGGPLRPQLPLPDGDLSIRGGVGGISFQLSELAAGAGALDVLVGTLTSVETKTDSVWRELCNYGSQLRSSGVAALDAVGDGRRAVAAVRQELQDIGSQVRGCQREYEAAESQSGQNLRPGTGSFELLAAQGADSRLTGFVNRETSEALARNAPLALGILLGVRPDAALAAAAALGGGSKGSGTRSIIRILAEGAFPDLKPRPVKAVEEATTDTDLDTSPAGLLARARAVDAQGQGRIEIIETLHDGHKAFIVIIPGTQPGAPTGGDNPFDEAGIAEGLGYHSQYTGAAIRTALQQAGAAAQDQVVAVGYSQGGVHAMNLSNDKAFLAEYDLKYVLTAGSPVGGITPQPGISSLHLEHRQDWVPGSDGVPSPDTRDRVTVTLTNRVLTPSEEEAGLGPGHRLTNYEEGARAVSASDDASLMGSTAALAGVVGTGGAATATRFRMVREPQVQPKEGTGRVSAARKERHPGFPYGGR